MTAQRITMVLLAFTAAFGSVRAQDIPEALADDQCVICHVDFGVMPEAFIADGIHMQPGLSCAGCHGGDPTTDDDEIAHSGTFRGIPSHGQIPAMCGSCHSDLAVMRQYSPSAATDQEANYYTSVHGSKLLEGDQNVATCASCHSVHAILPATDGRSSVHPLNVPSTCDSCHGDASLMADYGIRTSQYRDYAGSVHGIALLERQDIGAPACNDCHGNHGAAPPGLSSIDNVCGSCHVNNADYFSASTMAVAFEADELHACEECHGIHDIPPPDDSMLGIGDESVCMLCHEDGDDGYLAAYLMGEQIAEAEAAADSATVLLEEVERSGMNDVDIGYMLQEAHQHRIQMRTLVHTFDAERTGPMAADATLKARQASAMALQELDAFRFRRFGFGFATLMITLLTVALFFKIRDLDRDVGL